LVLPRPFALIEEKSVHVYKEGTARNDFKLYNLHGYRDRTYEVFEIMTGNITHSFFVKKKVL
jgi:hypothetical protein